MQELSPRAHAAITLASSWEEIWEAGTYYERIAELLEDAKEYAILAGWQIDSRLPIPRPSRPHAIGRTPAMSYETLKQKVIRLCEEKPGFQVYFLMWDHAYFYVFEREILQGRIWDNIHPRVHFIFDNRHPFGSSHHEKIIIIDGKVGFCGGIDLCADRWDSIQHLFSDPRRSLDLRQEYHGPYHDMAVQVTGPVVAHLQEHIAPRWKSLSSIPFPDPPQQIFNHINGGHKVHVSRTIAPVDASSTKAPIIREIEFLFLELIERAQSRLILEGQYYWSERINDALIAKLHKMRGRSFELILILAELSQLKSLSKQMAFWELRLLSRLEEAAKEAGIRFIIGRPCSFPPHALARLGIASKPGTVLRRPPPMRPKYVYVHSKVIIVDDQYLSIGSANLADRALRVDTEMALTLEARSPLERAHIRKVAERILEHWNIGRESHTGNADIKLIAFRPAEELRQLRLAHPLLTRIPWKQLFDPLLPWSYLLKRRFRVILKTNRALTTVSCLAIWALGALATAASLVPWVTAQDFKWAALDAILIYSSWLLPVPVLLASVLAAIQIPDSGPGIAVHAFWFASIWGYTLARIFPNAMESFYQRTSPHYLPNQITEGFRKRLGRRNFQNLLLVAFDPLISMRSKIGYQGLFWVHLPWFALVNLLLLPSVIYVISSSVTLTLPKHYRVAIAGGMGFYLGALALFAIVKTGVDFLLRNRVSRKDRETFNWETISSPMGTEDGKKTA